MKNVPKWHYRSPNQEELKKLLRIKMRNVFANYLVNKAKKIKKLFCCSDISPSGNMEEYQNIFK